MPKHIVAELLATEQDYVRDLRAVVDGYQGKLAGQGKISVDDLTMLFG
jgi:hypothetical protein